LGGKTLLDHVIARLDPQVGSLALNANGDASRFRRYPMPVIGDSVDGFVGPLAGVLAGLDWAAAQGAETIVTVAADTPFFPFDLVPRLLLAAEGRPHPLALAATRAEDGRLLRQPTFGLWPVSLREDLRKSLKEGVRKVVLWTSKHSASYSVFPIEMGDPFFNINTPEDLERAQGMIGSAT